jgi:hypothetical protein
MHIEETVGYWKSISKQDTRHQESLKIPEADTLIEKGVGEKLLIIQPTKVIKR